MIYKTEEILSKERAIELIDEYSAKGFTHKYDCTIEECKKDILLMNLKDNKWNEKLFFEIDPQNNKFVFFTKS